MAKAIREKQLIYANNVQNISYKSNDSKLDAIISKRLVEIVAILNRQLYVGARNLAGEVGHIRLAPDGPEGYRKRGSFEGFCSGGGIAQLIEMRTGEFYSAKELARRADAGDPQALAVWEEIGTQFGRGLAVLVDILNPEAVVAGSIYTRAKRARHYHADARNVPPVQPRKRRAGHQPKVHLPQRAFPRCGGGAGAAGQPEPNLRLVYH